MQPLLMFFLTFSAVGKSRVCVAGGRGVAGDIGTVACKPSWPRLDTARRDGLNPHCALNGTLTQPPTTTTNEGSPGLPTTEQKVNDKFVLLVCLFCPFSFLVMVIFFLVRLQLQLLLPLLLYYPYATQTTMHLLCFLSLHPLF